jgi:MFS family permease
MVWIVLPVNANRLPTNLWKNLQSLRHKVDSLCGILVFEVGSVLCAAATSSFMLIFGRSVAGIGASAIYSGGMNILAMIYPLRHRAPVLALLSAMIGISNIAAPPLGERLIDLAAYNDGSLI